IEKLFATAFTVNRLKRGGGGAGSDTLPSRATREQAMAFYQEFYHPENTVVTIVGDIFPLKALGQVQLNFGNFKKATGNQQQRRAPGASAPKTTAANSKPAPAPGAPVDSKSNNQPADQPSGQSTNLNPQSAIAEEPPQDKLRYGNSRSDMSESIV